MTDREEILDSLEEIADIIRNVPEPDSDCEACRDARIALSDVWGILVDLGIAD